MLASLNNQFYFSDVVIFPIEINLTPLTDIMSDASELIDQIGMMAGFVKEAHPFSSNKKQQQQNKVAPLQHFILVFQASHDATVKKQLEDLIVDVVKKECGNNDDGKEELAI